LGAIRCICSIRLDPTYIIPAKEVKLFGKFRPESLNTERKVCIETVGQTDMARSTRIVMVITALQTSD